MAPNDLMDGGKGRQMRPVIEGHGMPVAHELGDRMA